MGDIIIRDDSLDYKISEDEKSITFNLKVNCKSDCTQFLKSIRTVDYKSKADDGKEYSLLFNITTVFEGAADFTFSVTDIGGDTARYDPYETFFGGIQDTIRLSGNALNIPYHYTTAGSSIHEVGHRIGFRHQRNSSNNQMSYSHARKTFNGNDTKRLINGYLMRGKEGSDWINRSDYY